MYNQNNIHSIEYRFNQPQKINIEFLASNFEIISNPKNDKEYARVVLLRNTKQFRDVISIKETNYNILLIGLAEYNLINCKSHEEIINYLDDLIVNSHITMMVFSPISGKRFMASCLREKIPSIAMVTNTKDTVTG